MKTEGGSAYRRRVSTARKFEKMILLMLLFPEPLLPMSKTFLFFAFLSCSDGGDSEEPAAMAGAGDEPMVVGARMGDGASISKGKISSSEESEGTRVEDEDEDKNEDEGEGKGEDKDGCCCCCRCRCSSWCSLLVRGLLPSTSVGNSMPLESIVAQLGERIRG